MIKNIKSLFIIEEDDDADNSSKNSNESQTEAYDSASGVVNDKFLKVLARAIEENNVVGFDYFEFREFLRALNEMDMDEETRFKSAFANAQTMGATVEVLRESAKHYLDVLDREKGKFELAAHNRRTHVLKSRKDELSALEAEIVSKQEQIEKLKSEIAVLKETAGGMGAQIEEAELKVERTSRDFDTTHTHMVEQIKTDIQKINTYLT